MEQTQGHLVSQTARAGAKRWGEGEKDPSRTTAWEEDVHSHPCPAHTPPPANAGVHTDPQARMHPHASLRRPKS